MTVLIIILVLGVASLQPLPMDEDHALAAHDALDGCSRIKAARATLSEEADRLRLKSSSDPLAEQTDVLHYRLDFDIDPVIALDTAFLQAAVNTLCDTGSLLTTADVTAAQISIDAVAGATCTEVLSGPIAQDGITLDITEVPTGCDCGEDSLLFIVLIFIVFIVFIFVFIHFFVLALIFGNRPGFRLACS